MKCQNSLITIIIPIYNTEKFLSQCLTSAIKQTYKKIEIICINDGSTDKSTLIVKKFMDLDKRIKLINQSNKGLSAARNHGIREAKGDILVFLDSDDYISTNMCYLINEYNKKYNMDIIVFGSKAFPYREDEWLNNNLSIDFEYFKNFCPSMINKKNGVYPFACRQGFKKTLLKKGALFDENLKFGEDVPFQLCNFPFAQNILFVNDVLYFYRINRKNSLTHSVEGVYKILHHINNINSIIRFWDKNNLINKYRVDLLIFIVNFLVSPLRYDSFGRTEISTLIKQILIKYKIIKFKDFFNIKLLKKLLKLYIYSTNI